MLEDPKLLQLRLELARFLGCGLGGLEGVNVSSSFTLQAPGLPHFSPSSGFSCLLSLLHFALIDLSHPLVLKLSVTSSGKPSWNL